MVCKAVQLIFQKKNYYNDSENEHDVKQDESIEEGIKKNTIKGALKKPNERGREG